MYLRVVCFKFQETTTEQDIQSHCQGLVAFKERVPQIVTYAGGRSIETVVDGKPQWGSLHYFTFSHMEDIETYVHHPAHLEFIERYKHLWKDVMVCNATID